MRPSWFLVLLAGFGLCGTGAGAEPSCRSWWWPWSPPHCPCPCCPDDYCPKCLPVVCPVKCFGANDYCPKACPIVWPPCYPPWYTCGQGEPCGQPKLGLHRPE